jgi:LysR family transcriptional activator of nhaA
MEWLNYHHLLYFWLVAREGTIARASQVLRLAQPTISGQIRALEGAFGEKLFERKGRRLALTDVGRVVYQYADEIFSLGRELQQSLKGHAGTRPARLRVGVSDVVPKLIAYRLLAPALLGNAPVQLTCTEDKTERLLADLSTHEIDLVLADAPIGIGASVRAFNHLLGECGVSFFATRKLADRLVGRFPGRLDRPRSSAGGSTGSSRPLASRRASSRSSRTARS